MSQRNTNRPRRSVRSNIKIQQNKDNSEEEEDLEGDFEDSGSEASIPDETSASDNESSAEEFQNEPTSSRKSKTPQIVPKPRKSSLPRALKMLHSKKETIKYSNTNNEPDNDDNLEGESENFSVKDLTEQEKQLPNFLNLSESDSDDEDNTKKNLSSELTSATKQLTNYSNIFDKINEIKDKSPKKNKKIPEIAERLSDSDTDDEFDDVMPSTSDAVLKKHQENQFLQIQEQNQRLEEAKKSLEQYEKRKSATLNPVNDDVSKLLAMGESEIIPKKVVKTKKQSKKNMSDSDDDDLEEVSGEPKSTLPKEGLQVIVDFPSDRVKGKNKPIDLEMMMRRRINRTRKEYQVYMHKVHILCWLAHGNYVNKFLNDQNLMGTALSLIPSEKCYPENRVNLKYLEQITKWFNGVIDIEENKNEQKIRINKPGLDKILLAQMERKVASSMKNKVLIFVALLRSLGVKCRLILSFVVVPIRPLDSQLCSLSKKKVEESKKKKVSVSKPKKVKLDNIDKISQLDGADDDISSKKTNVTHKRNKPNPANRNSSTSSYWDELTKDILTKDDNNRRISHRSLKMKSLESTPSTSENIIKKEPVTPKHRNIRSDTTIKINSVSPGPVIAIGKNVTSSSGSKSPYFPKQPEKNSGTKRTSSRKQPQENQDKTEKPSSTSETKKTTRSQKLADKKSSNPCDSSVKNPHTNSKLQKSTHNKSSNSRNSSKRQKPTDDPKLKNTATKSTRKSNGKKEMMSETSPYFPENTVVEKCARRSNPKRENVVDKGDLPKVESKTSKRKSAPKPLKPPKRSRKSSDSSEAAFKPAPKRKSASTSKPIDRRVLSSDDETEVTKKGIDFWCEVYLEEEEQWTTIDVLKGTVHCVNELYKRATRPVGYIVAWDENGYLKDVTRRYVPHWNTTTRKLRVDQKWYEKALTPWQAPSHLRDRREDEQLDKMQLDAPLPTTVGEYKNHPLYALERHLLKFEAIYPPDAAVLGFVRKEPVYARECIYTCRSRDTWLKEAKVVKLGEKPYKIVKARPKYDRLSGTMITDKPLEIFGPWQCEDYVPPPAENGQVPRNAYGNVELFKPCMLPKGTVHLQLPGLNKIARKLGIDCAPAMTGFDYHSGWSHPVYDGFVICEEFKDQAIAAWEQEQEEAEQRAREKIEKRVYGNWRRIIKGLFIRERLLARYDMQTIPIDDSEQSSKTSTSAN